MATRAVNPYYTDPNIEAIASNIRRAFVDSNPGQTAMQRQHARYYGLQGDEIERRQRARSGMAGVIRAANGAVLTPEQVAQISGYGLEGGVDAKDPSQYVLFTSSNAGQPSSAVARAFVGAGHAIGQNQAVTLEDRELVARRENDAAAQRSAISAGPGYAAVAESKRKNDAEMDFKERTRWDKPVEVSQGAAVYPSPEDKRMPGVAPGTIPAPKPPAADRFVVSPNGDGTYSYRPAADGVAAPMPSSERTPLVDAVDPSSPTGVSRQPDKPGTARPAPKEPTPTDISPDEVMKLELPALQSVGAADAQWNVDSSFNEQYADKLPAARQAAAAAYQKSRNAADGQAAYLKALGIEPGSKWNSKGVVGRAFGRKPGFDPPKSAVGTAVTGPTPLPAAAAPAPASPGVIPPPEQRVPGRTYPTPRGPMTWTGTGWVPPSNVK